MDKVCPIIYSGMLAAITLSKEGFTNTYARARNHSHCLEEECAWYKQGCPAHPISDKAAKRIKAICES